MPASLIRYTILALHVYKFICVCISKKMYQAHLLVVVDFENSSITWALLVANIAFLSASDLSITTLYLTCVVIKLSSNLLNLIQRVTRPSVLATAGQLVPC